MAFGKFFNKRENNEIHSTALPVLPPTISREEFPEKLQEASAGNSIKSSEPFFVRIDKFNDARGNLHLINGKLKEMGKILEKIEETKTREDHEIDAWKMDIKEIRENLSQIDEDIFNKI